MSNHSHQTKPTLLKRKRDSAEDERLARMSNYDEARSNDKEQKNDNILYENEENDPSVYEKTKKPNKRNEEWSSHEDDTSPDVGLSSEDFDKEDAAAAAASSEIPFSSCQTWSKFRSWSAFLTPRTDRTQSLPKLDWADSKQVWDLMCHKDDISLNEREEGMFQRHPCLQPRMRAILLDWLIEVCEVYKIHRETYHLTVDYLDRYLTISKDVPKQQLQLIGITCLFIAAKIEEIYPPKLAEFAYVTDGACSEKEILNKELVILKVLNWNLTPVTANTWLNVFMQVCADRESSSSSSSSPSSSTSSSTPCLNSIRLRENMRRPGWGMAKSSGPGSFLLPKYSGLTYVQIAQLIDLCMLEEHSMSFTYSTLAASAMYLMYNREKALFASGMQWSDLEECVRWMTPYAQILREEPCPSQVMAMAVGQDGTATTQNTANPDLEEAHTVQIHTVDLNILEKAQKLGKESQACAELSQENLNSPPSVYGGCLTPPSSQKKSPPHSRKKQAEEFDLDTTILDNSIGSNSSTITISSNETLTQNDF